MTATEWIEEWLKEFPSDKTLVFHIRSPRQIVINILAIILVYSAKTDNQLSFTRLFYKAFKSLFELIRAFSCRINVSNTNAFVWLG